MSERLRQVSSTRLKVRVELGHLACAAMTAAAQGSQCRQQPDLPIAVYGDSMATQVYRGLRWAMRRTTNVSIHRHSCGGTGLVRDDEYDWLQGLEARLRRDKPKLVVVSLGGNDRQDIRTAEGRIKRFSEEWWLLYRARVERTMALLNSPQRRVFWLALPAVRSQKMSEDLEQLNTAIAELTGKHAIRLVDSRHHFVNANGRYVSVGRDVSGRLRRLRHRDGIHFSQHGERVLAVAVLRAIRDDNSKN